MALLFAYTQVRALAPVWGLHGRLARPTPLIPVTLVGPANSVYRPTLVDTGASDTVFPENLAAQVGIDLSQAPQGRATSIGGTHPLRYAEVELRLTDGREYRVWTARVGFTPAALRWPLLGFAGVLQFFTVTFHGDREEVELSMNSLYRGT
jgi:hypothetical protein